MKQKPKELTLCKNCWCETKTIDYKIGKCGKCGQTKYQKKFSNLVKKLLTQQRTELLEEIEAIVEEQLFWYQGEDYGSITAREALNQVKNLLNKQNETK